MKRYLIILYYLTLSLTTVEARFSFRTLDVQSGISDNFVNSILCDQYGFMWFATSNGLNRYDGYQYKLYTTIQLGTHSNRISSLTEDAAGNLWIRTPNFYTCYNREKDTIEKDISHRLAPMGITGEAELICVDDEKNLFCKVGNTLYYYVFKENRLYQIPLPNKELMSITCRNQHAYLLFGDGEISQVNWQTQTLEKETRITLPSLGTNKMYLDSRFCLWIYTKYSPHLQCYDTYKKEYISLRLSEVFQTDFVTSIVDDGIGNVWIGTNSNGIYISEQENHNLTPIPREPEDAFSLPSSHINCLYKDDQNTMWVGTTKQGVAFTNLRNISFEVKNIPEFEDILFFQEDMEGNIWMGLDGKGIGCLHKKDNSFNIYNTFNSNLPSNLVIDSYIDADGRLWFSSYGNGIFYKEGNSFHKLVLPTDEQTMNTTRYVRHFFKDIYGNLWIDTMTHGIYCINFQGNLSVYNLENSCLPTNSITDMVYSHNQTTLYIGTGFGLYKLDIPTQELTPIIKEDKDHPLNKLPVTCLYQDNRGLLWIGTTNGICIYNLTNEDLIQLSTDNALSHPNIKGIVEDKHGNIWLSTDEGITHITVALNEAGKDISYHCHPYFEEDGIGNITFNTYSAYCTSKGEILMGGTGKYLMLNPAQHTHLAGNHKVIFTGLYLANQRIDAGIKISDGRVLLPRNIQLADAITMEYSNNSFALEVSAMNYVSQHKLQFYYRMGENEEWVKLKGNRIYFNKLSPGTYHLQVKVNEMKSSEEGISELTIHIYPPFWLSRTAYLLYLTIITAMCVCAYLRIRQKDKRLMARQKREMEIHQQRQMDEAKMRFFTNVGHDLRTPLSLIITPLEKLLGSDNSLSIRTDLQLIHRNASILLEEINLLLDFRKLDQQKAQLSPSYGDWTHFILETATPFYELAEQDNITLHLQTDAPQIEMDFDRNKMRRIVFNLLSNAIKYNRKNGEIAVQIGKRSGADGEFAELHVADTGIGIKDENKERVFDRFFQEEHASTPYVGSGIGLHIVKEYVALHDGSIKVTDNYPQGSVFTVTFPIKSLHIQGADGELELVEEQPPLKQIAADKKTTLLIVEDNNDFRQFLVNCLKGHYQILEASDGENALSVLADNEINMVISDVMMPIMDGIELCHRIKNDIRHSHIPVILLTARTADEHIVSGLKEGADDYITKPFNIDILLLRIQKLLKWTQNNHIRFKTIDISPSEITISTLDEQLIEKAIKIVESNMDNSEFSVEEFSAKVGMSRSGLYKKLIQITGKAPLEFMRILRLKRGRYLLENSQLNISQIAYQVGLSPKQFAKFFKEEFGCLPSEYNRKKDTLFQWNEH